MNWEHVKGHSGIFGNELADGLARYATDTQQEFNLAARPDYLPYVTGPKLSIEHFWLYFTGMNSSRELPAFEEGKLRVVRISPLPGGRVPVPEQMLQMQSSDLESRDRKVNLFLCSYNVGTLAPREPGVKIQYLREQLDTSQMVTSATHVRVTSAANSGVGGTEVWLLRRMRKSGVTLFDPKQVQVYVALPEVLILRATCSGVNYLVVSAHAPHTGRTEDEQKSFWDLLTREVRKYQAQTPSNLFLPSTFEQYHEGPTTTWVSPANGQTARCDYIALPLDWCHARIKSYVLPSIDSGRSGEDHIPVAAEVYVFLQSRRPKSVVLSFDRVKLQRCCPDKLRDIFGSRPCIPWEVDVDTHAHRLSEWVQQTLSVHFPKSRSVQRKSYIREDTWSLRTSRNRCRNQLRASRTFLAGVTLRVVIRAWRQNETLSLHRIVAGFFRGFARCFELRQKSAMLSRQLSKKLKVDRTAQLEQLARGQAGMSQQDFIKAFQALGVQSRRRPTSIRPLPVVHNSSREPCLDYREVAEQWRRYFGEQEDGIEVDIHQLFKQRNERVMEQEELPNWNDLPSVVQLERLFRNTRSGKGYFVDGVPGDVLHMLPELLVQAFYPLYVKELTQMQEAMIYKGGRLVPSFKRGDPSLCSSYRSLFVSSPIGKALHVNFREELVRSFSTKLPMQIGGLPGFATTQAALSLSLFHRFWLKQGDSVAFLYVDISDAFYRLLREHFTECNDSPQGAQEIFHKLGLPPAAWQEFTTLLRTKSAIELSQASPFVRRMYQEFFSSTWLMGQMSSLKPVVDLGRVIPMQTSAFLLL